MINTEKIKNYIKEHTWIDFALITIIIIVFALLFAKHMQYPLIDKGREFFLSEQILKGKIPFKDITMIYFPFAYYINALIFKFLGVSIDSLVISQAFFCIGFAGCFYLLAKEFLSRSTSLLLTILIISSCIFSKIDIFSYIMPYSYAAAYGYMSFVICAYCLVKLFKTDNIKFAYFASLAAGFCLSCKMEFASVLLLVFITLIFYKKLRFTQYLNIILLISIFPILLISILHYQGITFEEIKRALEFARKFATSGTMTYFLSDAGMYPLEMNLKLKIILRQTAFIINIAILSFVTFLIYKKYNFKMVFVFASIYIWYVLINNTSILYCWYGLPILMLFIFCIKIKNLYLENKAGLILILGAIFISQRVFFGLNMVAYGTYPLPLLLLTLCVILNRFCPKQIMDISSKHIMNYILIILIGLYSCSLWHHCKDFAKHKITSDKGTIYVTKVSRDMLRLSLKYINSNIDKNKKILVIPEGNMLNFLTDRSVDLHCFMMDKFYYAAYGEKESKDIINKADNDYIVFIQAEDIRNAAELPKIYFKNYTLKKKFQNDEEKYSIKFLERNKK